MAPYNTILIPDGYIKNNISYPNSHNHLSLGKEEEFDLYIYILEIIDIDIICYL
jgi:hypothetical protein